MRNTVKLTAIAVYNKRKSKNIKELSKSITCLLTSLFIAYNPTQAESSSCPRMDNITYCSWNDFRLSNDGDGCGGMFDKCNYTGPHTGYYCDKKTGERWRTMFSRKQLEREICPSVQNNNDGYHSNNTTPSTNNDSYGFSDAIIVGGIALGVLGALGAFSDDDNNDDIRNPSTITEIVNRCDQDILLYTALRKEPRGEILIDRMVINSGKGRYIKYANEEFYFGAHTIPFDSTRPNRCLGNILMGEPCNPAPKYAYTEINWGSDAYNIEWILNTGEKILVPASYVNTRSSVYTLTCRR